MKHFQLRNGTQFIDIHDAPPDRIRLGYNHAVIPNGKKRIEAIVRYWAEAPPISNDGQPVRMWWDAADCQLTFTANFKSGYFKGDLTHRHAISSIVLAKNKDEKFSIGLAHILNKGVIPKTDKGARLPAPRRCHLGFIQFEYGQFFNQPPDLTAERAMLSAIKELQNNVSPAGTKSVREEIQALKNKISAIELSLTVPKNDTVTLVKDIPF